MKFKTKKIKKDGISMPSHFSSPNLDVSLSCPVQPIGNQIESNQSRCCRFALVALPRVVGIYQWYFGSL